MIRRRVHWCLVLVPGVLLALGLMLAGCGGDAAGKGAVSVLYGGSLVQMMEEGIGPAFEARTGFDYQGEGKAAMAAANMIKDGLRAPDLYITPEASVNNSLMGSENGELLTWYITFARTEMVIGYNPAGPLAAAFEQAERGETAWYEPLLQPGLRLGRPDPDLAPLGYRALLCLDLAESELGLAGLSRQVFGATHNPAQIFPAEELSTRLEAGQLDAAFFYLTNAKPHDLPYVLLPAEINQGEPGLADVYARASYTDAEKGVTYRGAPVVYTVAILENAANPEGALAFIDFLLSAEGQGILEAGGAIPTPVLAGGNLKSVPSSVAKRVTGQIAAP